MIIKNVKRNKVGNVEINPGCDLQRPSPEIGEPWQNLFKIYMNFIIQNLIKHKNFN